MDTIKKIKEYAINNNVPILRDKTLKILLDKIQNIVNENPNKEIHVLEIGTAIAYTTIQIANVSPNIYIDTIEKKVSVYERAKQNVLEYSKIDENILERITLYNGDAIEILKDVACLKQKYDFVFIDANKSKYLEYFNICKERLKTDRNTYIFADNVLYMGYVLGDYTEKKHRTAVTNLRLFVSEIMKNTYNTKLYSIDDGFSITKFEKNN